MDKNKIIEKTVTLEELFEIIKDTEDNGEFRPYFTVTFVPNGYYIVIQRIQNFGYIIGVPGIGCMPAITFTRISDIDEDDLDELFKNISEKIDEGYNPEKLYMEQIIEID